MSFHIYPDPDHLAPAAARWCVDALRRVLETKAEAVLCASVGATTSAVFAQLRERHRASLDWSRVRVVQMAEFAHASVPRAERLATQLIEELIDPLGTRAYLMWQGDVGHEYPVEPASHARRLPAIDVALHGLTGDGRLGMGHASQIHAGHIHAGHINRGQVARVELPVGTVPASHALTLTPAPLLAARRSLVLACGRTTRDALDGVIHRAPAAQCPAAAIPRSRLTVMADRAAAASFVPRTEISETQDAPVRAPIKAMA